MKIIYLITIMIFTLVASDYCQLRKDLGKSRILFPTELIESILKQDKRVDPVKTVTSFFKIAALDSVLDAEDNSSVLNSISVDLDGDGQTEILGLFGPSERETLLGVFKKQKSQWYLIYCEPVYAGNGSPELSIANNYSKNKIFYVSQAGGRGTGVLQNYYYFYKLVDGKVHKCLELIDESYIDGWGLFVNQFVSTNFKISSTDQRDDIWVVYKYSFYPGEASAPNIASDSLSLFNFVNGEEGVSYQWDSASFSFKPEFRSQDSLALNAAKISCFGDFGNDKLFAKAFANEINLKLKSGSPVEIKLLKTFLQSLRKDTRNKKKH